MDESEAGEEEKKRMGSEKARDEGVTTSGSKTSKN